VSGASAARGARVVSADRLALWPAIDLMGGRVVRLLQGRREAVTYYDEAPAEAAKRFAAEGADGIHVVDLDAAFGADRKDGKNRREIEEILSVSDAAGIAVQVGGGLRSRQAVEDFLERGSGTRAVLGSLALLERASLIHLLGNPSSSLPLFSLSPSPSSARAPSSAFSSRIVVALDCKEGRPTVRGWTEDAGTGDAVSVARALAALGVTALLVTDVACDGAMTGPNLELLAAVRAVFPGEILASGGMRGERDIAAVEGALAGGPRGAIFGRALHGGATTMARLRSARDLGRPS
jgi:phosphoribosylformimino-5-aminoimidazole carboxamide ribonucleotide (ProFAR) isomerase